MRVLILGMLFVLLSQGFTGGAQVVERASASPDVPIPNAPVVAYGTEGSGFALTNEAGQYIISTGLKTGKYDVSVIVEGYLLDEVEDVSVTAPQETKNVNFFLSLSGGISGKVTDSASGNPLSNIIIVASGEDGGYGWSGVTDSGGNYRMISNLATGIYNVAALLPDGYVPKTVSGISVTAGKETKDVNLALVKSGIVSGRITASPSGTPLADVSVSAMSEDGKYYGFDETDSSGNYRITSGLGTGKYTISASYSTGSNFKSNVDVVAGSETKNVDLTLTVSPPAPSGIIRGKVTDTDDEPIPSALVRAEGSAGSGEGHTDENGEYEISSGLGTGTYAVTASATGYQSQQKTGVGVTVNQVTSNIDFKLTPIPPEQSGKISGVVQGDENPLTSAAKKTSTISCAVSPSSLKVGSSVAVSGSINPAVSGVTVKLEYTKPDSTTLERTVKSGSDGKYSDTYAPTTTGTWGVRASWDGNAEYNGASSQTQTFTVASEAGKAKIGVLVKDSKGVAVAGASVTSTSKPSQQSQLSGTTGSDGSVSFSDILEGSYTFQATKTGYNSGSASATLKASEEATMTITLTASEQLGKITITVKDDGNNPLSGSSVTSTSTPSGQGSLSGTTGADGKVTFSDVKEGSYTFQASKGGYTTKTGSATSKSGETVELTVTIPKEASGGGGTGIPGFPYESMALGLILGALILWIVQRRR